MKFIKHHFVRNFVAAALLAPLGACVTPGEAYYPSFPYQLSRMNDGVERTRYHMWISEDDGAIVTLPSGALSLSGSWENASLTFTSAGSPQEMATWAAELCHQANLTPSIGTPAPASGFGKPAGSQKIPFSCH